MKKCTLLAATLMAALGTTTYAQQEASDPAQKQNPFKTPEARQAGQAPDQAASDAQPAAARDPAAKPAASGHGDAAMDMDQMFVREAAMGNLFEIQVGQLAQERAQRQEVKQFAQRLVQDHQKASDQLKKMAEGKNWNLPTDLDPMHQAMLQHMQKKQGEMFEKGFVAHQAGHHLTDLIKYRDASQNLKDPALKQFASQQLPVLQQHYQQAQQLAGMSGEAMPAGATERGSGGATTPGVGETTTDRPGANRTSPDSDRPVSPSRSTGPGSDGSGTGAGTSGGPGESLTDKPGGTKNDNETGRK